VKRKSANDGWSNRAVGLSCQYTAKVGNDINTTFRDGVPEEGDDIINSQRASCDKDETQDCSEVRDKL